MQALLGLHRMKFSLPLIKEYQTEMLRTYGEVVSDADAQAQLSALVRSMFPTTCPLGGDGNEVGAVLPRLRDTLKNKYEKG
jgi:hypothetical protein